MRGWESHSGSHSEYSMRWVHAGGGALLRLGAHPIGAMLYLKREEGMRRDGAPILPVAVSAEVADLTQNGALDDENCRVIVALIDERPEEVTHFTRSVDAEVVDRSGEHGDERRDDDHEWRAPQAADRRLPGLRGRRLGAEPNQPASLSVGQHPCVPQGARRRIGPR